MFFPKTDFFFTFNFTLNFKNIWHFQGKEPKVVETVELYKGLLTEAQKVNAFMRENGIKFMLLYPELLAIYLGLCEKARAIHEGGPPRMMAIWLNFGVSQFFSLKTHLQILTIFFY